MGHGGTPEPQSRVHRHDRTARTVKLFFATDIHGSEVCWRKFLNSAEFYKADLVILGGDVTGKVMVPIVDHGSYWQAVLSGQTHRLESKSELEDLERQIRNRGYYPVRLAPDELAALNEEDGSIDRRFTAEMVSTLDRWLDMAGSKLHGGEIPCIVNGGNDDTFEIDGVVEASPCVTFAEGKVIDLDGFFLASMGFTNPTPWDTFREAPEADLATRIEAVVSQIPDMGRAIFNFHAPPFGTGLDEAPRSTRTCVPCTAEPSWRPSVRQQSATRSCSINRCCRFTVTFTRAAASRRWAVRSPSIPAASTATAYCRAPSSSST